MPKCPQCEAEINYLIEWQEEIVPYRVWNHDNDLDWVRDDRESACGNNENIEWECPVCYATIFYSIEDVEKFLGVEE